MRGLWGLGRWGLILSILSFGLGVWGFSGLEARAADSSDFGPNIPEVGSSLFDKIYSEPGGPQNEAAYSVPYPLKDFLDQGRKGSSHFVYSFLPFSRSLQRPHDLSFDPILNPRLVLTPFGTGSSLTKGRLFIGFLEAKDQLEIISYNDEAGRYEFQIVTEYSSSDPKVFYADRGKCLSCHQSQAPIFSAVPWDDTAIGVMGDLVLQKLGLGPNNTYQRELAIDQLFGPLEGRARDNVAIFDAMVREGAQMALQERVWQEGCGVDNKCRLGLLLNTLAPVSFQSRTYLKHSQSVLEQSPLRQQEHFRSFLSSSSIGVKEVIGDFGGILNVINSARAISQVITQLNSLSEQDDPATPRPQTLTSQDMVKALAHFSREEKDLVIKEAGGSNRLADLLIDLYDRRDPIFDRSPINKLQVLKRIFEELNSPYANGYDEWLTKPLPPKKLFSASSQPTFIQPNLNRLSHHCAQCHATDLKFPPQFLLGTENEVMDQIRDLKYSLLFKLENHLMPPNPIDREKMISSGDYEQIVEYIRSL